VTGIRTTRQIVMGPGTVAGGGGAGVTSFNGRTGVVISADGDYNRTQIRGLERKITASEVWTDASHIGKSIDADHATVDILITLPPGTAAMVGKPTYLFQIGDANVGFTADVGDAIGPPGVGSGLGNSIITTQGAVSAGKACIKIEWNSDGYWSVLDTQGGIVSVT